MADILQIDRVNYRCNCGRWQSLANLYFDWHCSGLRCTGCLNHEIDSCYCSHCLDAMPPMEARGHGNRCKTCLECPLCEATLALRGSTLIPAEHGRENVPDAPALQPTRAFYLFCSNCFWTSRQANMPDQMHASMVGWTAKHDNQYEIEMKEILDYFRRLAAIEKADRDRQKIAKRRAHPIFYSDKFGLSAIYARKHLGGLGGDQVPQEHEECVAALEDVPELDESVFTQQIDINKVSTLEQRLRNVQGSSADQVSQLKPRHKRYLIRRSLRCKDCEHNLCKGDFSPSSIHFKIQMFALLYVPEIRLQHNVHDLKKDNPSKFIVTIQNLTASSMHINLLESDLNKKFKLQVPSDSFDLPNRDETIELTDDKPNKDDPKSVVFRRRHKIGVNLIVTPTEDITDGDDTWLYLCIKYDCVLSALVVGTAAKQDVQWLTHTVKLNLRPY